MENEFIKVNINKPHSYKQIFKKFATYKKVKTKEYGSWNDATLLKYVPKAISILNV